MRRLRIGTRGSQLALAQATWVQRRLQSADADLDCSLVTIKTAGDRFVDRSLRAIGGKGLFVKEIEEALLAGEIDCAVHSMKDLPAELAPGLLIAAVPVREDARDVLITRLPGDLLALPQRARLGTSSMRRSAFLRRKRSDLEIVELRGNVDTRLRKLESGELDGIVLAAAGLNRLGIEPRHSQHLDVTDFVPAIGQGALAIECRAGEFEAVLRELDHEATHVATDAERAFLARIGGSCHTPLGAHALIKGEHLEINAAVVSPNGAQLVGKAMSGPKSRAAALGFQLAEKLLSDGAAEILDTLAASATTLPLPEHP